MDDDLLQEQREFYRAGAPEYDDWWQRRGPYDRGEAETAEWRRQVAVVTDALASFDPRGDVLELAGGTGWWTEQLAHTADHLTVVDASPENLQINRQRVARTDVGYVVADIFDWHPERSYDVVFFSFWLSHVPRPLISGFWDLVRSCLAPGGRVFLIDNRTDPIPGPKLQDPFVVEYKPDLHLRRLSDGSEYRVVKVMYEPEELRQVLDTEGWDTDIDKPSRNASPLRPSPETTLGGHPPGRAATRSHTSRYLLRRLRVSAKILPHCCSDVLGWQTNPQLRRST